MDVKFWHCEEKLIPLQIVVTKFNYFMIQFISISWDVMVFAGVGTNKKKRSHFGSYYHLFKCFAAIYYQMGYVWVEWLTYHN